MSKSILSLELTFVLYNGLLKSQSGATNRYPHLETFREA